MSKSIIGRNIFVGMFVKMYVPEVGEERYCEVKKLSEENVETHTKSCVIHPLGLNTEMEQIIECDNEYEWMPRVEVGIK